MTAEERLPLADLLLWAEDVLGITAEDLPQITQVGLAESALAAPFAGIGDTDFYPDPAERAAILCSRLVRNHPFPDGNKRVAYLAMRDQLSRAGLTWRDPEGGQDAVAETIEQLAAREMGEADFIEWVRERVLAK